jgi:hypothetical protein
MRLALMVGPLVCTLVYNISYLSAQDTLSFSKVIESWKRVAAKGFHGEYRSKLESSSGLPTSSRGSIEDYFVSAGGFLVVRRSVTGGNASAISASGLNRHYAFILRLNDHTGPELVDLAFLKGQVVEPGDRSALENRFIDRHRVLRLHPALFVDANIEWLRIVSSTGFQILEIEPSKRNSGGTLFRFSCKPTENELAGTAKEWIPVVWEGEIEVSSTIGEYLPLWFSLKMSLKPETDVGALERTNEFIEIGPSDWRLNSAITSRNYQGRQSSEKITFDYTTNKEPDINGFCISRFGLPEPPGLPSNLWTSAWRLVWISILSLIALFLIFNFSKKYLRK